MLCTLYALTQKSWNVSLLLRCQRTVTSSTVNRMSKRPSSHSYNSGRNKKIKRGMESNAESSKSQHTPSSNIEEINGDLFTCPKTHSLAHCISADVKMGRGIAVMFKNQFGGVEKLKYQRQGPGGLAVLLHEERYIYYLVTKWNYWDKPTYETLGSSLEKMRDHNLDNKVTNLCMPKIGCGLDGLKWYEVRKMITQIYQGTNIKITVYHYEEDKKDKQTKPDTAEYDEQRGPMHQNNPSSQNRHRYDRDRGHGRGQSRGPGGNSASRYNHDGSYNEYGQRQSRGSGGSSSSSGSWQSRGSGGSSSSSGPWQSRGSGGNSSSSSPWQSRGSGGNSSSRHTRDGSQHEDRLWQPRDSNIAKSSSMSRHPNPKQRQTKIQDYSSSRTDSREGVKTSEEDWPGLTKEPNGTKDSGKKDDDAKQYGGEGTTGQTNQEKQALGNESKPVKIDRKTYKAIDESHDSRGGVEESGRNDEDRDEGRHSEREDRSENTVKDGEKKKETKKGDGDERQNDNQNDRTKKSKDGERSNQDGSGNKKNAEKEWNDDDEHPGEKERSREQTNDHGSEKKKDDDEDDTFSQDQIKVTEDLSQEEHKKSQVKDEENSQELKEDSEALDIQSKTQRECSNKEDVNSDSDGESTSVETAQEPGGAAKDDKGEAMAGDSSHGSARRKRKNKKKNKKKKRKSVVEEK